MKDIPVSDTRSFAIVGHTGSGKTTLTDAMLFKLGVNDRLGSVTAGSSVSDYTDEEKARKTTIFAKPLTASYKAKNNRTYNLVWLDTPGYMDFFGQVIAAVRAADTGLLAVDAASGVQVGTHRVWKGCDQAGLAARGIVVTGLDRDNTDYWKTLGDIQAAFGNRCVAATVPLPDKKGVLDVLAATDVPEALADRVQEARNSLVERAAETDDALLEKYLGGETLTPAEIATGLEKAVARGTWVPVFAVMALKDIGVTELLEGIGRLFPAPTARAIKDAEGAPVATGADDPFVGQVWRTVNDSFVGHLAFVRVLGGTLTGDTEVLNASNGQKERIGSFLVLNGKKQEPVTKATAGDIVAVPKLKATVMSDTLCSPSKKVAMSRVVFPQPVMFMAVTAKTQADEDKIGVALSRVCEEDPTLRVEHNKETKEIVLAGLGDVQLDVAVSMMKSRSHVEATLSTPKIPYRETVTGKGEGHYKHKKQSGGRGQYGEVYLRIEPKRADDEEWFVDAIVGGVIPGNFLPAIQKGLVEGMQSGALAGYPVTNIKASVYDGSYHDVDSSEIAFKIAGARALRDAMTKAKPVLLEPIMTVRVMIPDHFMGDINGDLNHRRGRILGMGPEDGMQVITAEVPRAELFRYAAELRSMTGGQGSFEMEYSRYEIVPSNVAQKIIASAEKKKEEEE